MVAKVFDLEAHRSRRIVEMLREQQRKNVQVALFATRLSWPEAESIRKSVEAGHLEPIDAVRLLSGGVRR